MLILGLNMFHADASAAIFQDGELVFAVAEERLNRVKHYAGFPLQAIQTCLRASGAKLSDLDHVAVGSDPRANLSRKVQYALSRPANALNFARLKGKKSASRDLKSLFAASFEIAPDRLRFREHQVEHHLAHIASSYFCSPWESSAGYSYDGSGDFVSAMMADCHGSSIKVLDRVFLPHSLGSLYTMVCEFIGYRHYGDEGKVMGLAPYGGPAYRDAFRELAESDIGQCRLNLDFFQTLGSNQGMIVNPDGTVSLAPHFSSKMVAKFGEPRIAGEITQRDKDLAFCLQQRFEELFFAAANTLHSRTRQNRLALAGGCALNSVANGKLFDATPFETTWIQPAAGDEGLAIGAALYAWHAVLGHPRNYEMTHSYHGPEFADAEIEANLRGSGLHYSRLDRQSLLDSVSADIADGKVVGWFQGRMEWGPRALGNRSILAHPGHPGMKDILNARIKQREWFRPFAPSIIAERQGAYFEHNHPSPFMLHVYRIRPERREELCAVNHVDDTGRLHTVARHENPLYYDLISAFEKRTGTPVLLNTSFNENEPIVCEPAQAIDCFKRTRMDTLAIGSFVAVKTPQRSDAGKNETLVGSSVR